MRKKLPAGYPNINLGKRWSETDILDLLGFRSCDHPTPAADTLQRREIDTEPSRTPARADGSRGRSAWSPRQPGGASWQAAARHQAVLLAATSCEP
jgi:hypothetical protein